MAVFSHFQKGIDNVVYVSIIKQLISFPVYSGILSWLCKGKV